jgi:hypothetical protein
MRFIDSEIATQPLCMNKENRQDGLPSRSKCRLSFVDSRTRTVGGPGRFKLNSIVPDEPTADCCSLSRGKLRNPIDRLPMKLLRSMAIGSAAMLPNGHSNEGLVSEVLRGSLEPGRPGSSLYDANERRVQKREA